MLLVPLEQAASLPRRRVGGKALGLARLVARGLPVPAGVVLPVEVFRDFLRRNGLWRSACDLARSGDPARSRALRASVESAPLPPGLSAELRRLGEQLGPWMAVRSSCVDEDGDEHSWAGVFRSELGVRPGPELELALRRCWASTFGERALAYAARQESPSRGSARPGMALVLQQLVRARCAGVAFSVNAMTGSWREMTVEAAWGLGEAVVGGHVVPDHYLVQRPRRLPEPLQRLAARVRLEVVEESVQPQQRWLVVGREGLGWRPVPRRRRRRRKLSRDQLMRVCRLALRAEALGRCPQDVEWALDRRGAVWLLQARPVTAPSAPYRVAESLWTRRFIGERWSEPATPLGWSLVRPLLEHFIAYPRTTDRFLGGGPSLRLVQGAPFINATVFRHLAFKLPGLPPPRFMMDMLPPEEERAWMARFAGPPGVRVYAAILRETFDERRWKRFRWNPFGNHKAWQELELRLEREVPARVAPPAGATDPVQALARAEAGMELAREYVKVHVTSLLFANLWYQLVGGLLAVWLGPQGASLATELLRCPEENLTIATHHDLWTLAQRAAELEVDLDVVPDPNSPFGRELESFLARHGHRSEASWEIMSPRWAEHPERVLSLLRHSVGADEADPRERAREQGRAGQRALRQLEELVQEPVRRRVLRYLVDLTRAYLLLRENQRYHFDRLLFAAKRNYLVVGQAACDRGVLHEPLDVRFLEADEVEALVRAELEAEQVRALVAQRREQHLAWRADPPPDFLLGRELVPVPDEPGRRLQGLGTSPGVVRGRVRVAADLECAGRLQAGEILVARAVDPSWTPLFSVAGGLVLELGSQLSHGAVVAREYRLPMVVNLRGATQLLQDGQEVVVDGARGLVWLHG